MGHAEVLVAVVLSGGVLGTAPGIASLMGRARVRWPRTVDLPCC